MNWLGSQKHVPPSLLTKTELLPDLQAGLGEKSAGIGGK